MRKNIKTLLKIFIFYNLRKILHGRVFVIRKTCPCNEYPLEPHFYIAGKIGTCRGRPIFVILGPKHRLWVLTIYVLSNNKN